MYQFDLKNGILEVTGNAREHDAGPLDFVEADEMRKRAVQAGMGSVVVSPAFDARGNITHYIVYALQGFRSVEFHSWYQFTARQTGGV